MLSTFQNAFRIEELRNRIIFVLLMLVVFRIGAHIPVPGIDRTALSAFFQAQEGTILSFFDMFSGGALGRLTVFALGIMPYISASIIIQLMTVVFPYLERLSREGEAGRKKITSYTRYGTIALSLIQGFGISVGLQQMTSPDGASIVLPDMNMWGFRLLTMITLTAGTSFLMWIGEQINERGIGNGISLIIFAGIVTDIPGATVNSIRLVQAGQLTTITVALVALIIMAVAGQPHVRRAEFAPAAEDQLRRSDSADFRVFHPGLPGDHHRVHPGAVGASRERPSVADRVSVQFLLRVDDHVLLFLLHGDPVQPGQDRG
jgi:preprotein translocase subunit SecY